MKPGSILETVLYNADLESARWFYESVLGFPLVRPMGDLGFACRVDENHVLLIFDPRESDKPGRSLPVHGARGPGHLALRITEEEHGPWLEHLSAKGVAVEAKIQWSTDDGFAPGRSIYIRDPYGNSVELITADIWRGPSR